MLLGLVALVLLVHVLGRVGEVQLIGGVWPGLSQHLKGFPVRIAEPAVARGHIVMRRQGLEEVEIDVPAAAVVRQFQHIERLGELGARQDPRRAQALEDVVAPRVAGQ